MALSGLQSPAVNQSTPLSARRPRLFAKLPDEILVKILHEACRGERIRLMPTAKQHFRPSWISIRQSFSIFRKIANDPQVILPSSDANWIVSSPHAISHLDKIPAWLGITASFQRAHKTDPRASLCAVPALHLQHISIELSGAWLYKGQVEFELWVEAICLLPDLVSIDITWTMTPTQHERSFDYLGAILQTINKPLISTNSVSTACVSADSASSQKIFKGRSIPDNRIHGTCMRFHLEKSAA